MHGIVEPGRFLGNQPRHIAGRRIPHAALAGRFLSGNGQRETANRGDRLAEFVVQLVSDQAPLLFDALVRQRGHFAPLLEARLGVVRLAFGQNLVLHGLRHAIERGADGMGFIAGERRQAECQISLLDALEAVGDDGKGLERALHRPERQPVHDDEHGRCDG